MIYSLRTREQRKKYLLAVGATEKEAIKYSRSKKKIGDFYNTKKGLNIIRKTLDKLSEKWLD